MLPSAIKYTEASFAVSLVHPSFMELSSSPAPVPNTILPVTPVLPGSSSSKERRPLKPKQVFPSLEEWRAVWKDDQGGGGEAWFCLPWTLCEKIKNQHFCMLTPKCESPAQRQARLVPGIPCLLQISRSLAKHQQPHGKVEPKRHHFPCLGHRARH